MKFLLLLFWIVMALAKQEVVIPEVSTELQALKTENGKLSAGDIVSLKINVPAELSFEAEPEFLEKLKEGPVDLGEGRVLWIKRDASSRIISVGITSYAGKPVQIPAISFMKDGKPAFKTQPKTLEFVPVGGDKEKDDIYPPMAVRFPQWILIVIGLGILILVLLILWGLSRYSQRMKLKRELQKEQEPKLNAFEEFQKLCFVLREKNYLEKTQFKLYYFGLSDAAKHFLGRAFQFDAEESTTRELVNSLQKLSISQELIEEWKAVFEEMDLVKFTDQKPMDHEAKSLMDRLTELSRRSFAVSPTGRPNAV